jgi:uncharacterized membrane protein
MIAELFPWDVPILLRKASAKLPELDHGDPAAGKRFTVAQRKLVATIVHNAGIYNAIVAGGLAWAAAAKNVDVARVMLAGAVLAGVFGTATLKSIPTAVQAIVGLVGLFLLS